MVDDIRAQRDRLLAELPALGYRACRQPGELRAVRRGRRPARDLRALLERDILIRDVGIPAPLRVTAGTAAETDFFLASLAALGAGAALGRLGAMSSTHRTARLSRATSESSIDLVARPRRHRRLRHRHHRAVLRPPAHRVREALAHRPDGAAPRATPTSTCTTRSRTSASCSARRSSRRSATSPASPASATPSCPLDEALAQAVVDISGRPYLVHSGEPAGFEFHLIGGHFTGSMVRHVFEAITFNAGLTVHVTVLAGRDPHHIAEAEFKAFARAFRQAVAPDPRVERHPVDEGRAVSVAAPIRRRARLRLRQRALGREGARARRRPRRADRRPRPRRRGRRPARARRRRLRRGHGGARRRCAAAS